MGCGDGLSFEEKFCRKNWRGRRLELRQTDAQPCGGKCTNAELDFSDRKAIMFQLNANN